MTLRPAKWILYAPVAALPLLAAMVVNGSPAATDSLGVVQTNWVWLLAAWGLGIWVGWAASAKADPA